MNKKLSVFVGAVSFSLIILAVFFDLSFSRLIYNRENIFALAFEYIGEFPIYLMVSWCFIVFQLKMKKNSTMLDTAIKICYCILSLIFLYFLFFKIYSGKFCIILDSILALASYVVIYNLTSFFNENTICRLHKFCVRTIFFIALIFFLNRFVKSLWGRIRFEDLVLMQDYTKFMPFWEISPFSGNKSFYSGHVTSSCCLFPLLYLIKNSKLKKVYKIILILSLFVFIFLVGFSRIIYGAHFISDVTFAFLIAWICYAFIFKDKKIA